jgi:hypothetical protein
MESMGAVDEALEARPTIVLLVPGQEIAQYPHA